MIEAESNKNSDITTLDMDNIWRKGVLDDKLPDPQKHMYTEKIQIELNTGLVPTTPLIIDNNLVDIKNLFLSGNNMFQTYAIDGQSNVIESKITSIPQEVYVNEIMEVGFDNGLFIECTPNAGLFSYKDDFKPVHKMKVGEEINGAFFDNEYKQPKPRIFHITHLKKKFKAIAVPVYYFFCMHQNVLLPYFDEANGVLSFIDIHQ